MVLLRLMSFVIFITILGFGRTRNIIEVKALWYTKASEKDIERPYTMKHIYNPTPEDVEARRKKPRALGVVQWGARPWVLFPGNQEESKGMRVCIIISKWCLERGTELLFKALVDGSASCQAHHIYSDNTIDRSGVYLIYAFAV